jgi:hypothetical protein
LLEAHRQRAVVHFMVVAGTLGLWLLAAPTLLADPRGMRLVLAAGAGLFLVGLALLAPRRALLGLLIWLSVLGLGRRLASEVTERGEIDPLLAVGPAAVGVLVLAAWERGAFERRTRLANAVLVLAGLVVLGALNPLQGSITAGVTALLFVGVPLAGFWIGRGLVDDGLLRRILLTVAGLSIAAAAYGMAQTFWRFPSWDATWVRDYGYEALVVSGVTRPFGPFASASEYAIFLAIGLVVWLRLDVPRALRLPAAALLVAAIVLASGRGVIFTIVAALAATFVARRRLPLWASLAVGAVAVLLVPAAAGRLAPESYGGDAAGRLLAHQVEGLAHPFDPERSTFLIHLRLVENGVRSGLGEPLGIGISAITIAGEKLGGTARGTEADPSNMAVALGLPGLLLYFAVAAGALVKGYRLAASRRDPLALIALAAPVVSFLQWLNGGHYAVALLVWVLIGWIDAASVRRLRGELE